MPVAALVTAIGILATVTVAAADPADRIIRGGAIVTVNAGQPTAEAVAIAAGKIVAVGNEADVMRHRGDATVVTGFYRPNLTLDVTPVVSSPTPGFAHKDTAVLDALRAAPKGPGIVYVTQQKTAERVAALLTEAGIDARAYHAGLDAERRTAVQDHFMAATPDDDVIVVASVRS